MKYRYIKLVNGYPCCMTVPKYSSTKNFKTIYGQDCYELILEDHEELQERYVINSGELKVATEYDKYKYDGIEYKLPEEYYMKKIKGKVVDILPKPKHNYIQPYWSDEIEQWIELADDIEVINFAISSPRQKIIDERRQITIQKKINKVKGVSNAEQDARLIELSERDKEISIFMRIAYEHIEKPNSEYEIAKTYINKLVADLNPERPSVMNWQPKLAV